MEKPKKYSSDENLDSLHERASVYETSKKEKLDPRNTDEQEILLQKLLALGLKQSEMGLGRPHEEVWAEMKLKYNFK
jgi:hypothetical protein